MMTSRTLLGLAIAGVVAVGAFASSAGAAPISPVSLAGMSASEIDQVSFWGLPYPYGYRYRPGRGFRHVYGVRRHAARCQKVMVCR